MVLALGRIDADSELPEPALAFATDDFRTRLLPVVAVLLVLSRLPPLCLDVGIAVI